MRTIALAAAAVATIGSANAFDVAPKFTPGENGELFRMLDRKSQP